jgi:methylase of polypeptide subunit release factors
LVRGILSDTVEWHVYDIRVAEGISSGVCTPEHVTLSDVEYFVAETADDETAQRLKSFLRKHLAREQSRQISSRFIAGDLGLESPAYGRHTDSLMRLVQDGRAADSSVGLATDLWSRFVDYLEHEEGDFRVHAYVDEAYIAILARLLCANILEEHACLSDEGELADILTGEFFETRFNLRNMVEQDYFGWLLRPEYLPHVLPVALEIQTDLYAYDFSTVQEEDLFGRLMSQLARKTQRKLLGQEWTPQWIARALAEKCISLLPRNEPPCFIDMCCGSGSIMAEVIKAARRARPRAPFAQIATAVTGFDIDPLAVMLAKTTWVVTLADGIRGSEAQTTVPVYHADSLFAVTPTTRRVPMPGEDAEIVVELDGHAVSLPAGLVSPEQRAMFDDIVDWCYDEARGARDSGGTAGITAERAGQLVAGLANRHGIELSAEEVAETSRAVFELAHRMGALAVANRNGIWAFILRNTYRPGLLAGQFNGLVSNPPWLTMSQLADNPYKEHLTERAQAYGIKPSGAAHLHLELATTHLLHAVDRYLKTGAGVACLVPGTVLNGQHHAKLRDGAFLTAERPVPFGVREVWDVAPGTFKVRAVVLIGAKSGNTDAVARTPPAGAIAAADGIQSAPFAVRRLGNRTAWVVGDASAAVVTNSNEVPPQGADLMPRAAVCVEIVSERGPEWRVKTPGRRDPSFFAVKDGKQLKDAVFNGYAAPCFIHRMAQSLNLLPFVLDANFTRIAIPARRDSAGRWEAMDVAAIRTAGLIETARRFERIDRAMKRAHVRKPLHEYIDERGKLTQQVFPPGQYLVFNGAGGGIACAAMMRVSDQPDIVIDQTLYWSLVTTEDESWYRTGVFNTDALTAAIRDFNPEGELGPRHLHTLPNRVMPRFDPLNPDHMEISSLARQLSEMAIPLIADDPGIADPCKPIASRRRRLRSALKTEAAFATLESAVESVLADVEGTP